MYQLVTQNGFQKANQEKPSVSNLFVYIYKHRYAFNAFRSVNVNIYLQCAIQIFDICKALINCLLLRHLSLD